MPKQRSAWARGAIRQRKFEERLDGHFNDEGAVWFIAMQPAHSSRLGRWWVTQTGSASVLAVANQRVYEIPIGGNPALSFKLMLRQEETMSFGDAAVRFEPDTEIVTVATERFSIWPDHQHAAIKFCVATGAPTPDWAHA